MTIKEARESIGMSRAEMSRVFEIPIRTLEEWDAGRRLPPPYVEKLIVEKLMSLKK
jgi:DNA-binding transcriptional regulator YiaG